MDPWEIAFIILSSLLGLAILGFGGYNISGSASSFFSSFLFALLNFIPFGLISFGFIADLIGQEFRFSIASIMAILAIGLNKLLSIPLEAWWGVSSIGTTANDSGSLWCFVPGLENLESKVLPMNFLVMGCILTYYLIFASLNRNMSSNYSLYIAYFLFPILQGLAFQLGGCAQWYAAGILGNFLSWALGIAIGSIAYAIVNGIDPSRSPFGYAWSGSPAPSSGYQGTQKPVGGPLGAPSSGAKCSAADTDEDNAFVCEAYKNGVLVTEKIS